MSINIVSNNERSTWKPIIKGCQWDTPISESSARRGLAVIKDAKLYAEVTVASPAVFTNSSDNISIQKNVKFSYYPPKSGNREGNSENDDVIGYENNTVSIRVSENIYNRNLNKVIPGKSYELWFTKEDFLDVFSSYLS